MESEHVMTIGALQSQVLDLERKLAALHGGDLNHLRRAHATLTQHVRALVLESKVGTQQWQKAKHVHVPSFCTPQHIDSLISGLEDSVLSTSYVASEISSTAAIAAGAWTTDRLIRMCRFKVGGFHCDAWTTDNVSAHETECPGPVGLGRSFVARMALGEVLRMAIARHRRQKQDDEAAAEGGLADCMGSHPDPGGTVKKLRRRTGVPLTRGRGLGEGARPIGS